MLKQETVARVGLGHVIMASVLLYAVTGIHAAAQAGQVVYEMSERLDPLREGDVHLKIYSQRHGAPVAELLSYDFEAAEGACHPASLRLEGPDGETAVQLADIETWGDTPFVKRARLYFLLPGVPEPLSTVRYTLTYGKEPRPAAPASEKFVRLKEEDDGAVITPSRWGASISYFLTLGGETYEDPRPISAVPGPWRGLVFGLLEGAEGESRFVGEAPVRSWSARVTDRGPVFVRARFEYVFADGDELRISGRVVADDSHIRWEMESTGDRPDAMLEFRLPVSATMEKIDMLEGRGPWARKRSIPVPATGKPFLRLSPDSWVPNIFGDTPSYISMLQPCGASLRVRTHDPAVWAEPVPRTYAGHTLMNIDNIPEIWDHWKRRGIAVSYVDKRPVLSMDLSRGGRIWSMGVGPQYSGENLNRIKDMVLDWPDTERSGEPRPWLFMDHARVEKVWREVDPHPVVMQTRLLHEPSALDMFENAFRHRWGGGGLAFMMMLHEDDEIATKASVGTMDHKGQPRKYGAKMGTLTNPSHKASYFWRPIRDSLFDENSTPGKQVNLNVRRLGILLSALGEKSYLNDQIGYRPLPELPGLIALYDAMIDTPFLMADQRTLWRSRMAYLAYYLADSRFLDLERGYAHGLLVNNMVAQLSLGLAACALRDHPMAETWAGQVTQWMDKWLEDEVGPDGEWVVNGAAYGIRAAEILMAYAFAARRAGFHDVTDDPRLKRLLRYHAAHLTPAYLKTEAKDYSSCAHVGPIAHLIPAYLKTEKAGGERGKRLVGHYGGGFAHSSALFGTAAHFYAGRDADLSAELQWAWIQNGRPVAFTDPVMGRVEHYLVDFDLPARAPAAVSRRYGNVGAVLRHGFDTANETYLHLLSAPSRQFLDISGPDIGGIAQWFACGQPLGGAFTHGHRHTLLRNGVRLAHTGTNQGPFGHHLTVGGKTFAALPTTDYLRATYTTDGQTHNFGFPANVPAYPGEGVLKAETLEWTRQLLMLKDADPAGPAYVVVRDSVKGGQPTAWQFWTLSEKLGTAAEASNAEAFLADKPGMTVAPARELPRGDRYTALGQFGVDLEYFIAEPAKTPRHTLRYGAKVQERQEFQDLLHLQLPGDGSYYVALFPRPRDEQAPTFTALDGGKIIKVAGGFGTDYALLSAETAGANAEGVKLSGTVAALQIRGTAAVLTLGAAGEVSWTDYGIESKHAVSLHVADGRLVLNLPDESVAGTLTIRAPRGYRVDAPPAGVAIEETRGRYEVSFPAGTRCISLKKTL